MKHLVPKKTLGAILLLFLLASIPGSWALAQTDTLQDQGKSPQSFGFRFSIKPVVSVADFGRKDFNRDLLLDGHRVAWHGRWRNGTVRPGVIPEMGSRC